MPVLAFGLLLVASHDAVGVLAGTDQVLTAALEPVFAVDRGVVDVVLAVRGPLVTKVMTSATGLGSAFAALVFVGLSFLAGWTRAARVAAVALLISGVVVVSLMALVQRPFPPQPVCMVDGRGLAAHSFPSGHAAAVTVYALVARDAPDLPTGVVGGVAVLVAVSRIYLGTHYFSDTVVGVAIGVGAVLVARRLLDHHRVGDIVERLT
ncbi:phosphatase PAP2 family protein [Halorubellus salinus]|uniref:phosphatase PAP2 family protein n=1 Tax=Halorubellus salinus TaxID=755309 RepID=UPI001D05E9B4|nr:phosphatase PAP2 family protein [Halorubellus salinus]